MIAVQTKAKPSSTRTKDESAAKPSWSLPAANPRARALAGVISGGEKAQPKVSFGGPRDSFEQEADKVSDRVAVNAAIPQISSIPSGGLNSTFQKKAASEDSESVQAAAKSGELSRADIAADAIANKGGGYGLDPHTRDVLEARIGADFQGIRVHRDGAANAAAKGINARAFTNRSDIYLGPGESDTDLKLMAHEATHVVQQGAAAQSGGPIVQRQANAEEPVQKMDTGGEKEEVVQRGVLDWVADTASDAWDATGGAAIDLAGEAVDAVVEMGADAFWAIIDSVAPVLAPIVKEISEKGVFGYLKDKILGGMGSIFSALKNNGGLLGTLAEKFMGLAQRAGSFLELLNTFCCETLFQAIGAMKDALSEMAGDAWNSIVEFFQPIGAFFTDLWNSFGTPVLEWLQATGNTAWQFIKDLGATIWSYVAPIKNALSSAWDWIKDQLGIGGTGEGDSEGGLMGWITEKANSAWTAIKETLNPIVEPIQQVVAKVQEILPLGAIFNLRETVTGWLDKITQVASNMEGEDGVVQNQASLRDQIIPGVVTAVGNLQASLAAAGLWILEKMQSVSTFAGNMVDTILANPILRFAASAISWVKEKAIALATWAQGVVSGLFGLVDSALNKLKSYLQPLLNFLLDLAATMADIAGKIGDFVMGALFWWIPECIRTPIKDFILHQIIARIPVFNQLLNLPDIWAKVQQVAMTILTQIFVDGNLAGALWTFFKELLNLIGLPAKLIVSIIRKAAQALGDILKNPIRFLITLLKAVKEGFSLFFSNFFKHMFEGFMDWLFGSLTEAGIQLPKDLSIASILKLVMDVLGITAQKIWDKIAEKIGPDKVAKLQKALDIATGVWGFIRVLVEKGPAGLWEEIKSQLSNLWNIVINAAITWITEKIVTEVTVKLLSMLDPSGVMAVVNSCIAIYRAIESAVQYAKQMLQFVDRTLDGIAEIAAGAFASGAQFLESAMAKAIPIAIGFLANQVGLGNLSQKIKDVIEKVQETVDNALTWLVDKAWAAGKWILDKLKAGAAAVKDGVAALLEWWKKKKKFTTKSGESHTLFFQGEKGNAQLYVASKVLPFEDYVETTAKKYGSEAKVARGEKGKIASISGVDPKYQGVFDSIVPPLNNLRDALIRWVTHTGSTEATPRMNAPSQADAEVIATNFEAIASALSNLPPVEGETSLVRPPTLIDSASMQSTTITLFNGETSQDGTHVSAKTLSSRPGSSRGSRANYASALMKKISKHRDYYVQGHLLADKLWGPGNNPGNIAPITGTSNNNMSGGAEATIFDLVFGKNRVVRYDITASYPGAPSKSYEDVRDKDGIPVPEETLVPTAMNLKYMLLKFDDTKGQSENPEQDTRARENPENWIPDGDWVQLPTAESKPNLYAKIGQKYVSGLSDSEIAAYAIDKNFAKGVVQERNSDDGPFSDKENFYQRMQQPVTQTIMSKASLDSQVSRMAGAVDWNEVNNRKTRSKLENFFKESGYPTSVGVIANKYLTADSSNHFSESNYATILTAYNEKVQFTSETAKPLAQDAANKFEKAIDDGEIANWKS